MDAVILAAGKGTRLAPLTDNLPKALVPVAGKPIIDHIFAALPDEISRVCLVVSSDQNGDKLINYLRGKYPNAPISFIRQSEPKGTGHAFLLAGSFIQSDKFLVLNGDDIYNKTELTEMIKHPRALATQSSLPRHEKYLAIEASVDGTVIGSRYPEHLLEPIAMATGAYVLDRNIFHVPPVQITNTKEYGLPHAVLQLAQSHTVKIHDMPNWIQINDHDDLANAEKALNR